MSLEKISRINFRELYDGAIAETILHADELMDRLELILDLNPEHQRRNRSCDNPNGVEVYTADGQVFGNGFRSWEDLYGERKWETRSSKWWIMTRREKNPLFAMSSDDNDNNIYSLDENGYYKCQSDLSDFDPIFLDKLRLMSTVSDGAKCLMVRTKDGAIRIRDTYEEPNETEQRVITQLGFSLPNLRKLDYIGITDARIYVPSDDLLHEQIGVQGDKKSRYTDVKQVRLQQPFLWQAGRFYYSPREFFFVAGGPGQYGMRKDWPYLVAEPNPHPGTVTLHGDGL